MAGPHQGHFQDRGFGQSGQTVGQAKEQTRHELRQTEQVDQTVLQERHHEED